MLARNQTWERRRLAGEFRSFGRRDSPARRRRSQEGLVIPKVLESASSVALWHGAPIKQQRRRTAGGAIHVQL